MFQTMAPSLPMSMANPCGPAAPLIGSFFPTGVQSANPLTAWPQAVNPTAWVLPAAWPQNVAWIYPAPVPTIWAAIPYPVVLA